MSLLRFSANHVGIAKDRIQAAYDFLEGTNRIEIHGDPSAELRAHLGEMSSGAPVQIHTAVGGFSSL